MCQSYTFISQIKPSLIQMPRYVEEQPYGTRYIDRDNFKPYLLALATITFIRLLVAGAGNRSISRDMVLMSQYKISIIGRNTGLKISFCTGRV